MGKNVFAGFIERRSELVFDACQQLFIEGAMLSKVFKFLRYITAFE